MYPFQILENKKKNTQNFISGNIENYISGNISAQHDSVAQWYGGVGGGGRHLTGQNQCWQEEIRKISKKEIKEDNRRICSYKHYRNSVSYFNDLHFIFKVGRSLCMYVRKQI